MTAQAHYEQQIPFRNGQVKEAISEAGAKGKLVFLDFTAKWCVACKIMDEYTYHDTNVKSYLTSSYIPVRVDVQDLDGLIWKEHYNVVSLPTIIILDSRGYLLGKFEQSLTATVLSQILGAFDEGGNKGIVSTPAPPLAPNPAMDYSTSSEPEISKPSTTVSWPTTHGVHSWKNPLSGYSVQVGVYGNEANAMRRARTIQALRSEVILVQEFRPKGKRLYRVLYGIYPTSTAADDQLQRIRKLGEKGLVKNLNH